MSICQEHLKPPEPSAVAVEAPVAAPVAVSAADREWDEFVARCPHGYHEQVSVYGKNREQYGFRCDRVIVRRDGRIAGGAQVLVQPTPLGSYARVYRAPLALDDDAEVLQQVVRELEDLAKRNAYASLRVDTFPTQTAAQMAVAEAGFRPSRAWFGELASRCVPVQATDEELLAQVPHKKARYNIRLAQRKGVEVRRATSVDEFFELRQMSVEHGGFVIYPHEYYEYILNVFHANDRVQLLVAHCGYQALASLFNLIVGGRMYCVWIGMHRGEEERKLMAGYLLHYAAMLHARDAGCTYCDLLGDSEFKRKVTDNQEIWPLPQRKFFGLLAGTRRNMMECAWQVPRLRHCTNVAARRLGLRPRMPY